ncbi:MAG: hypothetical protein WCF16_13270, partial [Alphaproteobacteria bacterium]
MNSIVDLPRPAVGDALSPEGLHGAEAAGLLARFGSPLFVVFEEVLRGRYRALNTAFGAGGHETAIAYSYKTNYLPAVCAILHQEGAWAEVVSG